MYADELINSYEEQLDALINVEVSTGDRVQVVSGAASGLNGVVYATEIDQPIIRVFLNLGFTVRPFRLPVKDVEVTVARNKLVIDGFNIFFRALHGKAMCLDTGEAVQAVYGFLRWVFKLKDAFPRHEMYVVWDDRSSWRKELVPEYKANREKRKLDGAVWSQLELVKEALRFLPVFQVSAEGEEADDVIAFLVNDTFKKHPCAIVSNDQDMLQLTSERVVVVKPVPKQCMYEIVTHEMAAEEFGVPVDKLAMYRAFRGDTSDNLKGVTRLKSASIRKLVNASATVEDAIESSTELLTEKEALIIQEYAQRVRENYHLMHLDRVVSPQFKAGSLSLTPLKEFFAMLNFHGYSLQLKSIAEKFDETGFIKTGDDLVDEALPEQVLFPDACVNVLEQNFVSL